jgi:hypothetical protein
VERGLIRDISRLSARGHGSFRVAIDASMALLERWLPDAMGIVRRFNSDGTQEIVGSFGLGTIAPAR